MIETPLEGRFLGEGRRLIFSAPAPYHALIRGVAIAGVVMILAAFSPFELPFYPTWWLMIGTLLILASIAATFSIQMIAFDLKERTYRRRQGPGFIPRFTRGRIDDLDAIVVIAEQKPGVVQLVVYHTVLHWKGNREPIMVLRRSSFSMPTNQPLNQYAGPIVADSERYAKAMGIKFFDNSYFPGVCPVPFWN